MAGTATAVSGRVARRQQRRYAEQDAEYVEQVTPTATAPSEPEYMAELEQLAALRDQGVITPDEFEAKKKQVLGL